MVDRHGNFGGYQRRSTLGFVGARLFVDGRCDFGLVPFLFASRGGMRRSGDVHAGECT